MTTISAQTVLRSRNAETGDVLSTLLLRYPRFLHSELLTHRAFSRNSASSRAIPTKKLIRDVQRNPAVPIYWGKNQPGMQAGEEINASVFARSNADAFWAPKTREEAWLAACSNAVKAAQEFEAAGYHKQICNRLVEPFAHITVLVSATDWDNFLALRDHEDAEPHIRDLAREVRKALDTEPSNLLGEGEWHLPFITTEEERQYNHFDLMALSVARCASTSYTTVDGFDMDIDRARRICNDLREADPMHASPFEHVAEARPGRHANFSGFRQWRTILEAAVLESRLLSSFSPHP